MFEFIGFLFLLEPFESRVEFSQAFFGKDHCSVRSGRHDAFQ